jgi:hypothetical protein
MLTVKVSNNARSADELQEVLKDVGAVLGVPAEPGSRILLESGQPPFEIIVDIARIIDAVGVVFVGAAKCSELYKRLRLRIVDRRVQILFAAPGIDKKTLLYPVHDDTPNEAIMQIASDCKRKTLAGGSMRFWVHEGWLTYEEYRSTQQAKTQK